MYYLNILKCILLLSSSKVIKNIMYVFLKPFQLSFLLNKGEKTAPSHQAPFSNLIMGELRGGNKEAKKKF